MASLSGDTTGISRFRVFLLWLITGTGALFFTLARAQRGGDMPPASTTDKHLQAKLERLIQGFHGTAGVYVEQLRSGKSAAVNADTLFPTASIIKVPIMIAVFDKIKSGALSYHQPLVYDTSRYRADPG